MSIAGFDEVSHLLRRLGVDDSAKSRWLAAGHANHAAMIGDHSNLNATNASMARDHLLRIVSLKLVEVSVIE